MKKTLLLAAFFLAFLVGGTSVHAQTCDYYNQGEFPCPNGQTCNSNNTCTGPVNPANQVGAPQTEAQLQNSNLGQYGGSGAAPSSNAALFENYNPSTGVKGLIAFAQNALNAIIPLIVAIAFVVFLWGVFQAFILNGANEEKRAEGVKFVTYGIIGFFLMVSLWGLVGLLTNTFGFTGKTTPTLPNFTQAK